VLWRPDQYHPWSKNLFFFLIIIIIIILFCKNISQFSGFSKTLLKILPNQFSFVDSTYNTFFQMRPLTNQFSIFYLFQNSFQNPNHFSKLLPSSLEQ